MEKEVSQVRPTFLELLALERPRNPLRTASQLCICMGTFLLRKGPLGGRGGGHLGVGHKAAIAPGYRGAGLAIALGYHGVGAHSRRAPAAEARPPTYMKLLDTDIYLQMIA